jgi:hypothetical protein
MRADRADPAGPGCAELGGGEWRKLADELRTGGETPTGKRAIGTATSLALPPLARRTAPFEIRGHVVRVRQSRSIPAVGSEHPQPPQAITRNRKGWPFSPPVGSRQSDALKKSSGPQVRRHSDYSCNGKHAPSRRTGTGHGVTGRRVTGRRVTGCCLSGCGVTGRHVTTVCFCHAVFSLLAHSLDDLLAPPSFEYRCNSWRLFTRASPRDTRSARYTRSRRPDDLELAMQGPPHRSADRTNRALRVRSWHLK